jgi:hypothetical protein
MGEAWKPSNKAVQLRKSGSIAQKSTSHSIFRDMTPCTFVNMYQHIRRNNCLCLQIGRISYNVRASRPLRDVGTVGTVPLYHTGTVGTVPLHTALPEVPQECNLQSQFCSPSAFDFPAITSAWLFLYIFFSRSFLIIFCTARQAK